MLDEPVVTQTYKGYLLRPPSSLNTTSITSVVYQVRTSLDGSDWEDWEELGSATGRSNFNFIHDGTYDNVFYEYRYSIVAPGASSEYSDYAVPGAGYIQAVPSALDQLAASLGTFTSGFLRGVVFETSANYPKVRMDANGFFAISTTATPIFVSALDGSAQLQGVISAIGIKIDAGTATPIDANKIRWMKTTAPTGTIGGIYAYTGIAANTTFFAMAAEPSTPNGQTWMQLSSDGIKADLRIVSNPTGLSFVDVGVTGFGATILDSTGSSDFAFSPSDASLKSNISRLDTLQGLSKVLEMQGSAFTWKDTGRRDYGLVAQDVQKVIPEAVYQVSKRYPEDSKILTIQPRTLNAFFVEAIKALNTQIVTLEARIQALEQEK